jgi:hypothetical protein
MNVKKGPGAREEASNIGRKDAGGVVTVNAGDTPGCSRSPSCGRAREDVHGIWHKRWEYRIKNEVQRAQR